MKITRIEAWPFTLKLTEPYSIAYETYDSSLNVMLRMDTSTGISGWGCATPDRYVTGESIDDVLRVYRESMESILLNTDPLMPVLRLEELKQSVKRAPATICMVDMALHDLLGKVAGLPLYRLLGGYRHRMMTSVTIGILPVRETVEKARYFVDHGFRALKIKGGRDVEADIEKIIKVREAVGKRIELRFDANQGYTEQQAVDFATGIQHFGIAFFEQPVTRDFQEVIGRVTSRVPIPIMADESLVNLQDAFNLAKMHSADMLNIKLMKVGGIKEALRVNSVAVSAGFDAMVGCFEETALSIAAGLHFALAEPNVRYADLDGHLNLIDDPTAGTVKLKNGMLYPLDLPGLGFEGCL